MYAVIKNLMNGDKKVVYKTADLLQARDSIKHIQKKQHILTKMLIHLGCRADLYDDFIRGCFDELELLENAEKRNR